MSDKKTIVPSKEDVKKLLTFAMNDQITHMKTVGELLGMKLIDSLMPKIKGEPEWGYDGLKKFFDESGINSSDTFMEALEKLK